MTLGELRESLKEGMLAGFADEIEIMAPNGRPAFFEYSLDGDGGVAVLRVRQGYGDVRRPELAVG